MRLRQQAQLGTSLRSASHGTCGRTKDVVEWFFRAEEGASGSILWVLLTACAAQGAGITGQNVLSQFAPALHLVVLQLPAVRQAARHREGWVERSMCCRQAAKCTLGRADAKA